MPELWKILLGAVIAGCFAGGLVIWNRSKTYRTCAFCLFLLGGMIGVYWLLTVLMLYLPILARVLMWGIGVLLGAFLLLAGITGGFVLRTAYTKPEPDYPYLLVLGCVVNGTKPTRSLLDRIEGAAAYLRDNPRTVCIVSGGLGPRASITEAECMRRELIERGIETERIRLEPKAKTTWENLIFSREMIQQETGSLPDTLALVSSEYHMFRTGLMAKKQGFTMLPVPAKTGKFILRLNYTLREIGAVWRMMVEKD